MAPENSKFTTLPVAVYSVALNLIVDSASTGSSPVAGLVEYWNPVASSPSSRLGPRETSPAPDTRMRTPPRIIASEAVRRRGAAAMSDAPTRIARVMTMPMIERGVFVAGEEHPRDVDARGRRR